MNREHRLLIAIGVYESKLRRYSQSEEFRKEYFITGGGLGFGTRGDILYLF